MPEQKRESNTQVLTKSSLLKKILLGFVTGVIGLAFVGISWICGTVLTLQKDVTTTKADVKWTKEKIEERFKEKPEDMAVWEQIQKHDEKIRDLELKGEFYRGLLEGIHKKKMKRPVQEPDVDDEKPEPDDEETSFQERPKEKDTRIYRERHLRRWIQQQANEPPPFLKKIK